MRGSKKAQKLLGRKSCISCGSRNLSVTAVIDRGGYPPGDPKHNIGYDHVMLAQCQSCGCGLVERLDHDCFDFDSVFDQCEWYLLERSDITKLISNFQSCPNPMRYNCDCTIHDSLRSSIGSLPKNPWRWALEHELHVHRISVTWAKEFPILFKVTEDKKRQRKTK